MLLEAQNYNHDGGSAALRSPLLYRFVVEHYVPFFAAGAVFARLNTDPAARGPLLRLADRTDDDWERGVFLGEANALTIPQPALVALLDVLREELGDFLSLAPAPAGEGDAMNDPVFRAFLEAQQAAARDLGRRTGRVRLEPAGQHDQRRD